MTIARSGPSDGFSRASDRRQLLSMPVKQAMQNCTGSDQD
jgi:hypothetical protein